MAGPIVDPVRIARTAKPGETVSQDFLVRIVPSGTVTGSISGGGAIIRLREIRAVAEHLVPLTDEEIDQLPTHLREEVRTMGGAVSFTEVGKVGANAPLSVTPDLIVEGAVEFVVPAAGAPSRVDAVLILLATGASWERVEIPVSLVVGGVGFEFLSSPVVVHRNQEVLVPVRVTLPPGNPAAQLTFDLPHQHLDVPKQSVSIPAGGSATTSIRMKANGDAPLGEVPAAIDILGVEPNRPVRFPFTFLVKPFSALVEAAQAIEDKVAITSQGPPGPRSPVSDVQDAGNGGFLRRYTSGTVYWHEQTGARWVSGAILDRYHAVGGPAGLLGYPLSDESPTFGDIGRFTAFQHGSIYFSPQSGAHEIHGNVRERWFQLGQERSYLGLPVTDEMEWTDPDTSQPGRISHFERGAIGWLNEEEQPVEFPERRVFRSGHIGTSSVGGFAQLTLTSAGSFHYRGHLHNSGFVGLDCVVGSVIKIPGTEQAIAVSHQAGVGGTTSVDGRDEDWDENGFNSAIRLNWDRLRSANSMTTRVDAQLATLELVAILVPLVGAVTLAALLAGDPEPTGYRCEYTEGVHVLKDGNNRTIVEPDGVRCRPRE
ncbi:hypothetical protein AB0B66_00310 [Catellatospora sp. NPDC049111]|uniref:LGFP repeat-containing protein n=1 Tax=Catellatospora sp. NPDC049111 TaxID=3155271 RepID=UPI0033DF74A6